MSELCAGIILEGETATMEFVVTRVESDGALHQMRVTYPPRSSPPPPHLHPAQDETFEVVRGQMEFVLDGVTSVRSAPAMVTVPAGTVHQLRNPGDAPATVVWSTRPALRTGEFFMDLHAAQSAGDVERLLAVIAEYADVFCLVAPE